MKPDFSNSVTNELSMNCSGFAVLPDWVDGKIEQRLHAGDGNVRRLLPNLGVGVVRLVQIFFVVGLGILADYLFGCLRVGARDLGAFDVRLHVAAHFFRIAS